MSAAGTSMGTAADRDSGAVLPPDQVRAFRADGSYIITGGLGALGSVVAETAAEPC